jgi:hypothetical protein
MTDSLGQDVTTQILIQIRDEMRSMRSGFDARFDSVDTLMEAVDARLLGFDGRLRSIEAHINELFRRFNQIDTDLKRFATLVNEAVLHYAGEMDRVRDRLEVLETRLGASSAGA